jgi:thiopeptide-type bacteriocin biosynthesis protein
MSRRAPAPAPFSVDGFFALRTPLLPFTDYLHWASGLAAPAAGENDAELAAAIEADSQRLRAALRQIVDRPEVREAVYLASPSLEASLEHWQREPESERGRETEHVLVRYFQRMTHRGTPFGLFASHAVGRFDVGTQLDLASATLSRRTRFDRQYLGRVVAHFSRDRALRATQVFVVNCSLYQAAGRLRYTEFTTNESGQREYRLVAVADSPHLRATLERARSGATLATLAERLAEAEGVELDEAEAFIHELIDNQILVSDLETAVTGPDSTHVLAAQFENCATTAETGRHLAAALAELGEIDGAGPGIPPARYRELGAALESLPVAPELSKLLQVDLFRQAPDATLGTAVAQEIERCTAVLQRLTPRPKWDPLAAFKEAFQRRYEQRWIPLLEALDPETGIGFPAEAEQTGTDAPLLKDFFTGARNVAETIEWDARDMHRFRRVRELATRGECEWVLSDEDLDALGEAPGASATLPDSIGAFATLAGRSAQAIAAGEFRMYLRHCYGPSGARLLSRFCHGDARLQEQVEAHLRAEEAYRPDALFAEIVFLSQPRIGNVLARPVLRGHEIVFLGKSGAAREQQIALSDLLVSVVDDRVVLYSPAHAREIIPRLTSAALYTGVLGLYEFLGLLQVQQTTGPMRWSWGSMTGERFLPRVSHGRTVLARAQWRADADELKPCLEAKGMERFRRLRRWRRERELPRFCLLLDDDNEMLVDFDNVLSVDAFVELVRRRKTFVLTENFPNDDELVVQDGPHRYTHELVIPMLRVRAESAPAHRPLAPPPDTAGIAPVLAPGSEWLYLKLYGGQGSADLVLTEGVAPAVVELKARGVIDGWFFIRYSDPDPHLRVRLHGDPARLCAEALPEMHRHLDPMMRSGRLWRIELGTYQREIARYGGPQNMVHSERLFECDSRAVVAIVPHGLGDESASLRWQLVLAGVDRWLRDFGFDLTARHAFACRARDGYAQEMQGDGKARQAWFSGRFRRERAEIEVLINPDLVPLAPVLREGLDVLEQRSRDVAPLLIEVRALHARGALSVSLEELAHSLIHMFVNRMQRSAQRTQEFVIYEFLVRLYASELARRDAPRRERAVS